MSTATRILKNSGYLYLKMGFTVFVNLYSTRLILNALGASDFGIFGVIGSVLGMLGFLNSTLSLSTARFINYYEGSGDSEKLKCIFNNSMLLHMLLAVFLLVVFEVAEPFLFNGILNIPEGREDIAKWLYQFSVISTFFSILTVPYDSTINAHENMLYYAIIGTFESLARLVVAVYITHYFGERLLLYGLLTAIIGVFLLLLKQIYCRIKYQECRLNLRKYIDANQIKELAVFSGWSFFSTGGILVGNYGNSIILNHFFGTSLNAAQSVSSQIKGQLLALTNTMTKAMTPVIFKRAGSGDVLGMIKVSLTGTKLNIFLYAVLAIPFIVESPLVLKLWLNNVPDWALCFSVFEVSITLWEQFVLTLHSTLIATGNIKEINLVNFLTHIIPLFLFVLIFSMGAQPYWLYIIYAFTAGGISTVADLYYCSRYCDLSINYYLRNLFTPCICCIGFAIMIGMLLKSFLNESWLSFIIVLAVVDLLYCVLMYFVGLMEEERLLVNQIIKKIICSKGLKNGH